MIAVIGLKMAAWLHPSELALKTNSLFTYGFMCFQSMELSSMFTEEIVNAHPLSNDNACVNQKHAPLLYKR